MAGSVNLPAPYKGIAEDVPLAALQSPFCQNLFNFNTTQEGIVLRNGDNRFAKRVTANLSATKILAAYGDSSLFMVVYDTAATTMNIYNVETGILQYTSAAAGFGQFQPQAFNKYLFFLSPTAAYTPGIYYDGGAGWGVIGYTNAGTPTATFTPRGGGNNYNHRNYIIQNNEAAYWYSEIDAITGAMTKVDLSGIVDRSTTLANIAKITLSDQVSTVSLQVFCMANGEILFYSGSYPDGNDWQLVGKAQVGQLVSLYDSVFPYQGDAIILSDSGIASLRDLFLKGSQSALNLSINRHVQATWKLLIGYARSGGTYAGPLSAAIRGLWDSVNSRLYILLPYAYTPGNPASFGTSGNFYFVFDAIRESWAYHSTGAGGVVLNPSSFLFYKNRKLYSNATTNDIIVFEKEGSTGYTDRNSADATDISYDFDMITAPIPFSKTQVNSINGIEPILQSDLYALTGYKIIADLGRQVTEIQIIADQGTEVSKPQANVGLQQSTFAQLQISGATTTGKTIGLKLYSFNVWYDSGEKGSR